MDFDNRQEKEIGEVLAICKDRWRSNGISENEVETRALEVEEDLQDAVKEGKTVEEVVGPDVQEFARLYEEDVGLNSPRDRFVVGAIVVALFLVVAVLIALRLSDFAFLSWYAVLALSAAVAAALLFWVRRSR